MCTNELNKKKFYRPLGRDDPSRLVLAKVKGFVNRYCENLTPKEQQLLTSSDNKMANFYMLPKLHKNKELNEILSLGESPE